MQAHVQKNLVCLEDVDKNFLDKGDIDLAKDSARELLISEGKAYSSILSAKIANNIDLLGIDNSALKDFFLNLVSLEELKSVTIASNEYLKIVKNPLDTRVYTTNNKAKKRSLETKIVHRVLKKFLDIVSAYKTAFLSLPLMTRELIEDINTQSLFHKQLKGSGKPTRPTKVLLKSNILTSKTDIFGTADKDFFLGIKLFGYPDWIFTRRYGPKEIVSIKDIFLDGVERVSLSYFDNSVVGELLVLTIKDADYTVILKPNYLSVHIINAGNYTNNDILYNLRVLKTVYNRSRNVFSSSGDEPNSFKFGSSLGKKLNKQYII